jgi:hypothetical protein
VAKGDYSSVCKKAKVRRNSKPGAGSPHPGRVPCRERDLRESGRRGYTGIFQTVFMTARDEYDPLAPQREAAFFYGLFLRGHTVEALRQDIDVPRPLLDKWMRAQDFEAAFRENLQRVYTYRKQVLAIFDGLVLNEQNRPRVQ